MTTSPQLSIDIEQYMEGVVTEKLWTVLNGKDALIHVKRENLYDTTGSVIYSAYTLEQVLDRLPVGINSPEYVFRMYKSERFKGTKHFEEFYCLGYRLGKDNSKVLHDEMDVSPVEAAGRLLKWLGEKGHLKDTDNGK